MTLGTMMKRYLIKATITSGEHTGRTYLLRKGGYVAARGSELQSPLSADDYYTEARAKAVATRWNKQNELYQLIGSCAEPTKYEAVEVA